MKRLLVTWILSAISLLILTIILPGIHVSGFGGALMAALAIGIVNGLIKPVLQLISLPITVLTLGFFWLVVNALCFQLAGYFSGQALRVDNFGWAFIGAIVLSIVNGIVYGLFRAEDEDA